MIDESNFVTYSAVVVMGGKHHAQAAIDLNGGFFC